MLRKFVHQVGFIHKIIQGYTVNKTFKKKLYIYSYEKKIVLKYARSSGKHS